MASEDTSTARKKTRSSGTCSLIRLNKATALSEVDLNILTVVSGDYLLEYRKA